jgi:hypothetical protein
MKLGGIQGAALRQHLCHLAEFGKYRRLGHARAFVPTCENFSEEAPARQDETHQTHQNFHMPLIL